ncbi:MAG: EamA/RhaT family transporter [Denitrovibrio sp.]|nr:MAG: EamA/RhaT family transporter [Denitrovibrio sp.]
MSGLIAKSAVFHLFIGAFMISFSPVFARLAGAATSATGFYRMVFGLVGLAILFAVSSKVTRINRKGLFITVASGVFFSFDIYFWHVSILYVGPGLSTLLANFQVFFLAVIDVIVFKERVKLRLIIAIILAFSGLYLIAGNGWDGRDEQFRIGVIYGLLTALMYTGYIYTLRMAGSQDNPVDKKLSMFILTGVSGVILGVTAIMSGESLVISDLRTGIYLLAYGVLCQAFAWVIIASALPKVKLTISGLILLLQPAFAYVWDVTIFSKDVTSIEFIGAILALTGIYIGTIRRTPKS